MNVNEIVQFRDECNGKVVLYTDNSKIFDNTREGTHLVWDDSGECLTAIKPNHNHYELDSKPILMEKFGYDVIQYMGKATDFAGLKAYLENRKSEGLITQVEIDTEIS